MQDNSDKADIRIESARMADCEDFVNLLEVSAGEFLRTLLGPNWRDSISLLYSYGSTIFGVEKVTFARLRGKNLGMYTGFSPWGSLLAYLRTGWVCMRFLRKQTSPRFSRVLVAGRMSWCHLKTYYISNIAVYDKYRGCGIGELLMADAEGKAEESGFRRVSLDVEKSNDAAIGFYLHRRYRKLPRIRVVKLAGKRFEFIRMGKLLKDE